MLKHEFRYFRLNERVTGLERGVLNTDTIVRGYPGTINNIYIGEGLKRLLPSCIYKKREKLYVNVALRDKIHSSEEKKTLKELLNFIPRDVGAHFDEQKNELTMYIPGDYSKTIILRRNTWTVLIRGKVVKMKKLSSIQFVKYDQKTVMTIIDTVKKLRVCVGVDEKKVKRLCMDKLLKHTNSQGVTMMRGPKCQNVVPWSFIKFTCETCQGLVRNHQAHDHKWKKHDKFEDEPCTSTIDD